MAGPPALKWGRDIGKELRAGMEAQSHFLPGRSGRKVPAVAFQPDHTTPQLSPQWEVVVVGGVARVCLLSS